MHEPLFEDILPELPYKVFHSSSTRLGYSGTAIFSKHPFEIVQRNIGHDVGDDEGRLVMIDLPAFCLVNVYSVNSGENLKRLSVRMLWDSKLRAHVRRTRSLTGKPLVLVGDLNVAPRDIDVFDAARAHNLSGCSPEEREAFDDLLETTGMVDAFRMIYPNESERYTFWEYRTRAREHNRGWRIDHALVSDDMVEAVHDVRILDSVRGSDHCPVAIDLSGGMFAPMP